MLNEMREAIAAVVDDAGSGVVAVGNGRVRGAGVVIAPGRVLTNAHNVPGGVVTVHFGDERSERGTVVSADPDRDLAVVEVDTGAAAALPWRDDAAGIGEPVVALMRTTTGLRATFGTVSATGRRFRGPRGRLVTGAIEHTAPLARGASGGPVVDLDGRLVGLNTHRPDERFYLAQPATAALHEAVDGLGRGEAVRPLRLGIAVAPAPVARRLRAAVGLPERDGLLVRGVDDAGPGGRAGIEAGDLIVAADGQDVASGEDLFAVLDGLDGQASLELTVVRGAEERRVAVTFDDVREEGRA